MSAALAQAIKSEAHRLGFNLAGITSPDQPSHWSIYKDWIAKGRHGHMAYLADGRSLEYRANPRLILPTCRSILVLGISYPQPRYELTLDSSNPRGRIASYAWGQDYHSLLQKRLRALVLFIERQVGDSLQNRYYTDTGPVMERDLAQRAGLGWIGKNTCLINPRFGSFLFLAEIFLSIELEPDAPFSADRCGNCNRCIEICPTKCILPDRTIDANRCISYLTIELKGAVPLELRPHLGTWIFGCDICQIVCPWNRFAASEHDPAFAARPGISTPFLVEELLLTSQEFNRRFADSPIRRAKWRGYLRNVTLALGNVGNMAIIPALEQALRFNEPLVQEHAAWALENIRKAGVKISA